MATNPIPGGGAPLDPRTAARQGQAEEAGRQRGIQDATTERTASEEKPRGDRVSGGEKVQISSEARQLLQLKDLMDVGRKALEREPEVREEKVRQVKARLEAGVYQTQGIRDEVAHRLSSILRGLPLDGDA